MSVKDDLFQLIQSMSKSEKRYFKLDTRKGGDKTNNYLRLFDALNSMEGYDEEKIRQKFKGEKFIKHLPQEKKYLYEAILRSMRNYQSDKSSTAQIKEGLLDARYLYERGLYEQSGKVLKKIKKIAYQFEDYLAVLEIIKEELRLANDNQRKTIEQEILQLKEERDQVLTFVKEEFTFLDIYYRLFTKVAQQFEIKDKKNHKEITDIFPPEYLKEEKVPQSKNSQRRLYQSLANYYQLTGNYQESFKYHQKVFDWWESNLFLKKEQAYKYRIDLSNYIQTAFHLKKYKLISQLLEKLDSDQPQNHREQSTIFQKVYINRLSYHLNAFELDEAIQLIPEIEEGLIKYKIKMTSQLVLSSNIAIVFFLFEKFPECIKWLDKITNEQKTINRQDVQCLAKLLKLIALYESNDVDQVYAYSRSVQRFFTTNLKFEKDRFENQVLSFLKKIFNSVGQDQKEVLMEFKQFVIDYESRLKDNNPIGTFEFLIWTQSKLDRKSMTDLFKEKKKTLL